MKKDKTQTKLKKKSRNKRTIIVSLSILLALIVMIFCGGVYAFFHYYNLLDRSSQDNAQIEVLDSTQEEKNVDEEYLSDVTEASEDEIQVIEDSLEENMEELQLNSDLYKVDAFNLLLIGVDSRGNNYSGRSDSMILVTINKKTKRVIMTSFLRDTFVSIPGNGTNRLNAAYVYGGEELLIETIKANFGIDIDRCMIVNFYIVMDLVNAVDGIDVKLSSDVIRVMNEEYMPEINRLLGDPVGADLVDTTSNEEIVHLNGKQALAYSRVRYVGTDFARTARQREVIMLCLEKIKNMSLSELNVLAEEFLPKIRTDLTESDCASLLLMALNIGSYSFDNMSIPIEGSWSNARIRGMSVLTIDFQKNSEAWFSLVQGE